MRRYQIHDGRFGVAIYEAATAEEAMTAFLTDRAKCAIGDAVKVKPDGEVEAEWSGVRYTTVTGDEVESAVAQTSASGPGG